MRQKALSLITAIRDAQHRFARLHGRRRARFYTGLSVVLITVIVGAGFFTALALPPTRATNHTPTPVEKPTTYFPIGVFEDANLVGDPAKFERMLSNLMSRGLDSVLFTNASSEREARLLEASDRVGANVYLTLAYDFDRQWWPDSVPATADQARKVAKPIVERLKSHPSFKGYIVKDEPQVNDLEKVALMTEAFRQQDPGRPVMSTLIGISPQRAPAIFQASKPDVLLIDVYPFGAKNPIGDFTMTGFGYKDIDFVTYIREMVKRSNKPAGTPLWIILQSHGWWGTNADGGQHALREPTVDEVRAQNWLAIGEGATGIFWFVYSSQQGWHGLVDNPPLYDEVAALTARIRPLRELLLGLRKAEDRFTVTGGKNPYVSTLTSADGKRVYVVAVNRDVQQKQALTITTTSGGAAKLRDVETGDMFTAGQPIPFRPGDGRVLEVTSAAAPAPTAPGGQVGQQPTQPGVPKVDINYSQDIATWWANHPLNPDNPQGIPIGGIQPVGTVVDLKPGQSIQAVIDQYKDSGVTMRLAPGLYEESINTRGYSNIQIIADQPGTATIKGHLRVSGGEMAVPKGSKSPVVKSYAEMNACVHHGTHEYNATCEAIMKNLPRNVYFKNVTIDGAGTDRETIKLATMRDVVFDNVTFQGQTDAQSGHDGHITANAGITNIWLRGVHFKGNARWAAYLDGAHGSGIINSRVDQAFGSGGFLFLTNDDFTEDLNGIPGFQRDEKRNSQYIVLAGNTFGAIHQAIELSADQALVERNVVNGRTLVFAQNTGRCSQRFAENGLVYENTGVVVRNNLVRDAQVLLRANGEGPTRVACPNDNYGRVGEYTVEGNRQGSGAPTEDVGVVDGPNVVRDNCIGPECLANMPNQPAPPASKQPTATPQPTAASQPDNGISFVGVQPGQTVSGAVAIEVKSAKTEIDRVDFTLTGPKRAVWNEKNAPYFFAGNHPDRRPIVWNSANYPDGEYTLTATVTDKAGKKTSQSVKFRVANGGGATGNAEDDAKISVTGVRNGQTLAGRVNIEVQVEGVEPKQVNFQLMGPRRAVWEEQNAPYFFGGNRSTGEAIGWDATKYPDGDYTLIVTVIDADGEETSQAIQFRVENAGD
jgi:hypothetical protein